MTDMFRSELIAKILTPREEKPAGYSAAHLSKALEWIERNVPNGVALVARALSETADRKSK